MKNILHTSNDGQFKYQLYNGTAMVIDYLGDRRILVLPKNIDGIPLSNKLPDGALATPEDVEVLITPIPLVMGKGLFSNARTFEMVVAICSDEDADQHCEATDETFAKVKNIPDDGIGVMELFYDLETGEHDLNLNVDAFIQALENDDPKALVRSVLWLPF